MITPALIYDALTATDAQGNFAPVKAVSRLYTQGVIRSQIWPTVRLDLVKMAEAPPSPPPLALRLLRPAISLSGPAGQIEIAPYGQPTTAGRIFTMAGVAALVFGVPFGLGYVLGSNARRR